MCTYKKSWEHFLVWVFNISSSQEPSDPEIDTKDGADWTQEEEEEGEEEVEMATNWKVEGGKGKKVVRIGGGEVR